jgi:hypothetical protein
VDFAGKSSSGCCAVPYSYRERWHLKKPNFTQMLKKISTVLLSCTLALLLVAWTIVQEKPKINLSTLIKINAEPSFMLGAMAADCADVSTIYSPHEDKYIDVYIDSTAYQQFMNEKNPNFPKGTILVKKKYKNFGNEKPEVELYTIMTKVNYSASVQISNWNFQILDKDLNAVKDANVSKCIQCHSDYSSSDFVTRENYFSEELRKKLK